MYLNYLTDQGEPGVRSALGGNYQRLAALKKQYDPTNFFHLIRTSLLDRARDACREVNALRGSRVITECTPKEGFHSCAIA